jgi:hypothetical protein
MVRFVVEDDDVLLPGELARDAAHHLGGSFFEGAVDRRGLTPPC